MGASGGFGPGERMPQIEVVTRPEPPQSSQVPRRRARSLAIWFLAAFALVVVPASIWNFSRPPVYRAAAAVLTIVPQSRSGFGDTSPDLQHVTIQRQLLLGRQLLEGTLERVKDGDAGADLLDPPVLTPDDLRPLLAVDPIPNTNLVEMSATGGKPRLLAALVNDWLAAYEALRQQEIERQIGDRLTKLDEQAQHLELKLSDKRALLETFRQRHDIVTLERDNNQALSRLNTLQASLADAEDELIKTKAELKSIQAAIANGQELMPKEQAAELGQLQTEAAELRVKVAEMRKRYTQMFIESDPNKRALPEQLARLEARIAELKRQGLRDVVTDARQSVDAATGRMLTLKRELSAQKLVASRFSTSFSGYEDLRSDLEALEEMQRETESERVALEAQAIDGYPQVEIIEPAYAPRDPFSPPYMRDLALSVFGGVAAGLATVLMLLFLDAKARGAQASVPVTGVRIWSEQARREDDQRGHLPRRDDVPGLTAAPVGALPDPGLRQLMGGEVEALWDLAADSERQLIGLLLAGVRVDELAALTAEDFDLSACTVALAAGPRRLCLPPTLCRLLASARPLPAWQGAAEGGLDELLHRIPLLAMDAGLAHAAEVDAAALRHTYLVFLVRQGARLTELHRVAGPMGAAEIQRYAPYSPSGVSRPLEQLELIYPALA